VLCHQFLGQVPPPLRQAVIGNVGTLVAFRVGSEDAPLIAAELGRANPGELTDTSNFQAWAKVMHGGVPSNAYSVRTFSPPQPAKSRFDAVRARSRARHTRPRAVVEAQIAQFLSGRKSHKGRRAAW